MVGTNVDAQIGFSASVAVRDRYVFPIGLHAYKSSVIQSELSAFWENPSDNLIRLQSIGYSGWGSYGIKSKTIHEFDHVLFANFNLRWKLNLSLQLMAWTYPDGILAFVPGQYDRVTIVGLNRDFEFAKNQTTNFKLSWWQIYKVGDLKSGTGFMGEVNHTLPSLFKIVNPSLSAQTFYSQNFYMFKQGFLEVRGGVAFTIDLKCCTATLDFKYQKNLQKEYESSGLFYTGFFYGLAISF